MQEAQAQRLVDFLMEPKPLGTQDLAEKVWNSFMACFSERARLRASA